MAIHAEVEGVGTLEFPDGTDPAVIQATVKKQIAAKTPPTEEKKPLIPTWKGAFKGVGETALTLGAGVAQQAIGVPKHLAQLAESVVPSGMTPEQKAQEAKVNAQPGITEKLQGLLSYTPKTEEGKLLLKQIQDTLQPVSEISGQVRGGVEKVAGKPATDVLSDVIGLAGLKGAGTASKGAQALKRAVSTEDRVRGIAENLSGGKSLEKADVGAQVGKEVTGTLAKAKSEGSAAYDELGKIMGPSKVVRLEGSALEGQKLSSRVVVDPTVKAFATKLQTPGMTFEDLKDLRTQISDSMGTDRNVNRQLRSLRDSITKDIEKSAEDLSPEAKAAWDTANAKWKAFTKAEDTINRTLGKNWQAKTSAELYQKVFAATSKDPRKMANVMNAIKDPAVRRQYAASMIHHMSNKGGEFDGDKFVRFWDSMDPQARRELFASVGGDYEANMSKLVQNLKRIKEGHTGMIKEVSGIGIAAVLSHFVPGGTLGVGAITLGREAYKFGPKAIESYLTSPQWVRTLAERTTAALERGTGAAVVATQQANRLGDMSAKPPEPARVGDVQ